MEVNRDTTWQKIEIDSPRFRAMRHNPKTRERREWPYIDIGGSLYRVRRAVGGKVAFVTEVTSPIEKFAFYMEPTDTPFLSRIGKSNQDAASREWSLAREAVE